MKKIDFKSLLIGLLLGTNLMFLLGANSKQKVQDVNIKYINPKASFKIRNNDSTLLDNVIDVRVVKR